MHRHEISQLGDDPLPLAKMKLWQQQVGGGDWWWVWRKNQVMHNYGKGLFITGLPVSSAVEKVSCKVNLHFFLLIGLSVESNNFQKFQQFPEVLIFFGYLILYKPEKAHSQTFRKAFPLTSPFTDLKILTWYPFKKFVFYRQKANNSNAKTDKGSCKQACT